MATESDALADLLRTEAGVASAYRHQPKVFEAGEPITRERALLKWYDLHAPEAPIPGAIATLARAHVRESPDVPHGLGFVVLHRCGADFYFLIVATWRENNELWETVFYKDGDAMPAFALFPRDGAHKPVFCVWELAPVLHEKDAWTRFLRSARDEAAARAWLGDVGGGEAP